MLGRLHSVQEEDVGPSLGDATEAPPRHSTQERGTVPTHIRELYETACGGCASNKERQAMAKLLRDYGDVFSSGDNAAPIRQPTRRLGPEKEKEVSRQVRDLLDRGLIDPSHSA